MSQDPAHVRVASVPADHVYVRHLDPDVGQATVVRLPDPPTGQAGRWWPPGMLEPQWVRDNADRFDLMHIHFGFDARSPEQLQELVDALDEAGRPLVFTVHDLRNPHHLESDLHDAQLDVLVPAAAELITLTPGAAQQIRARWGREARVLPHPHVFDLDDVGAPRQEREDGQEFRIGLHCKSLRACMDPEPIIRTIVGTLPSLPGAVLQVDAHCDIMDPHSSNYARSLATYLRELAEVGAIDLRVHDYFTHEELRDYLRSLDLSVLPYRFGTHSGWAEGCHDLGTGVLAPAVGFYGDQLDCFVYRWSEFGGIDRGSLRVALRNAYDSRGRHPILSSAERRLQRDRIARAHDLIYREVLSAARGHETHSAAKELALDSQGAAR